MDHDTESRNNELMKILRLFAKNGIPESEWQENDLKYIFTEVVHLIEENSKKLSDTIPKAEYVDELVYHSCNISVQDTSKEIGCEVEDLVAHLLECKFCYLDQDGILCAYPNHIMGKGQLDEYFTIKDYPARYDKPAFQRLLVTPYGRYAFRLLFGDGVVRTTEDGYEYEDEDEYEDE